MHSIHLEFSTVAEMEDFFSSRRPYTVPNFDGLGLEQANPVPVGTCTPIPVSLIEAYRVLQDLLTDSRFEWRKVATVVEKTGLTENNIVEHFNKEGIDYEITTGNQGTRLIKANY